MRIMETRVVPATTRQVCVKRKCDLCGAEAKGGEWPHEDFHLNETTIKIEMTHTEGSCFPEGGMGAACEVDLCPKCFRHRLVPWLNAEGASLDYVDWDW